MNKQRYSKSSVFVYKHGLYGYRNICSPHACGVVIRTILLFDSDLRKGARANKKQHLPVFSWSLYRESMIKITSQPTGITTKHNFLENRSLFARMKTRIASLLTHNTSILQHCFQISRRDIPWRRSKSFIDAFTFVT